MLFFIEPQTLRLSDSLIDKALTTKRHVGRKFLHSIVETESGYTVSVDMPGIEAGDVSVTSNDGSLCIKTLDERLSKTFQLNPKIANVENIKASLTDGVLTVNVPMYEPIPISVSAAEADPADETKLTVAFDVPGVKLSDLKVALKDNSHLAIEGFRQGTGGSKQQMFSKAIAVDSDVYDFSEVKATLSNGVLVVAVPRKPEPATRDIEVASTDEQLLKNEPDDELADPFQLSLDLPGVKKSDVSVKVQGNKLSIAASRHFNNSSKVHRMAKETILDPMVQCNNMRANLVDGVLTVMAPRSQRPAPKNIEVVTRSNDTENDQ